MKDSTLLHQGWFFGTLPFFLLSFFLFIFFSPSASLLNSVWLGKGRPDGEKRCLSPRSAVCTVSTIGTSSYPVWAYKSRAIKRQSFFFFLPSYHFFRLFLLSFRCPPVLPFAAKWTVNLSVPVKVPQFRVTCAHGFKIAK